MGWWAGGGSGTVSAVRQLGALDARAGSLGGGFDALAAFIAFEFEDRVFFGCVVVLCLSSYAVTLGIAGV